jgi:hypothetical protein
MVPVGVGAMTETSTGSLGSEFAGGWPVNTLIATLDGRICRSPELAPSVDRKFRQPEIQLSFPPPG